MAKYTFKIFHVLVWIQVASFSLVFSRFSVHKCGSNSTVVLSTEYHAEGQAPASCGNQGNVEESCRKNMYAPVGKCSKDSRLSLRVIRCTGDCTAIVDGSNTPSQVSDHRVDYSDGSTQKRITVDTGKLRLVSQIVVTFNWTISGPMTFSMSYGLDGKNWIDYTIRKLVKTFRCERSGASACLISGRKVFARYLRFNFETSLAQWNQGDLISGKFDIFNSPDTVFADPNNESVAINDTGHVLGCFVEDPSARYMLLSSGLTGYALQDQWDCMARCNNLGARFAAIEAGIQCNCGYTPNLYGVANGKSSCVLPFYGSANIKLDQTYGKPGHRVYRLPINISSVVVSFPLVPLKVGEVFYVSANVSSNMARVQLTVDYGDGQRPFVSCNSKVGYRFTNPGQYLVKVKVKGYSGLVVKQEKLLTVRGPPEEPGLECPSVWPTGTPAFFTVTQARGVDVTGNLTILGVRIPITVPDAELKRVGEDANIESPYAYTTELTGTRLHMMPLVKITAKGHLQSVEYYVVKPGPIRIHVLRPSHYTAKDDGYIRCTGSWVFVLDKCSCYPTNNASFITPGVPAKPPVNYTLSYDFIMAHPNSVGYHVVEISNLTGVKVVPGDIVGWTTSNSTGQIATISTASSVQGWTLDLPANDVKVGATFGPLSNITTTNFKYAVSVYILNEPEVTINYTFNSTGNHSVRLDLQNSDGKVARTENVLLQDPITDLKLLVPECVLSRQPQVFAVSMTRGTDVTFTWNFGEDKNITIFKQNTVTYQYNNTGSYTVQLTAFNKVTAVLIQCQRVEVIHAVKDLVLKRLEPTAVNQMVVIGYSLGGGSKVNISFSISDGYHFDNITNLSVQSLFALAKNHSFSLPGIYHVTVVAANKLSNATAHASITIQTPITGFKVETLPTHHNGDRNLTLHLSVAAGTNVSYYVTIEGATINDQRLPGLWVTANGNKAEATIQSHDFLEAGIIDIKANASNLVTSPIFLNFRVEVQFPISGLRLSISESAVKTNQVVKMEVTVGKGSNAFALLMFNGTTIVSHNCSKSRNFTSEMRFDKPGVYEIQLFVNNSLSWANISKIIIVQVPIVVLNLTTNSPRAIAPDMVTFNLTLPIGLQHPTHVTVIWAFGDGGLSNKKTFASHSMEKHGYTKGGVYTAVVNATNLVSSYQKRVTFEVYQRITHLTVTLSRSSADPQRGEVAGGPDKNYFPLDYDVVFAITEHDGTGVRLSWNYGDGSAIDVTNSSMLTQHHRFERTGTFMFTLTASNALSNHTITLPLSIERGILDLKVSDNSPRTLKQNTTFKLTMSQFGTETAIEVDLGDGTKMVYGSKARENEFRGRSFTTVNESIRDIAIVHFYKVPKEYQVNILAHNKASRVTLKYKSVLLFKPCRYPVVNIIGLGATPATCMRTTKSRQFMINTDNHIDCQASRKTLFIWKVFKYNGPNTNGTALNISTSLSDLPIPKRSLPLGINEVVFTVKMVGVAGVETTARGFICVEKSPLVANIAGGSGRSEGYDKVITIDGTPSEDPDVGPGVYKDMNFTWLCRKVNESFPANVMEMPLVSLQSKGNASRGGCYGTGLGPLNISTPSFKVYTGDLELTDYVFELRIQKGDRHADFSQRIKVVAGDPPSLQITCVVNCKAKKNNQEKLSVEGKCTNYGAGARLLYKWELFERSSAAEKWRPIPDERFKTTTGRSSKNLVVSPEVITPGTFCMLKYSSWIAGGPKGYTEYQFSVNVPPLDGNCTISSSNGIAVKTYFTVTCPGWVDPDLPLSYTFSYKRGSHKSQEELLYVGTKISTPPFTLPVGLASKNFSFEITVHINDAYGSYAEVGLKVRVTEPQISSADLQALTSGSGAIADKVLAGDTQAAAQLITAVCSVLNTRAAADQTTSNKTVTPDGKVLTPEEKKKQEEEAAKAKAAATEARTGIVLLLNDIKAETLEELQQQSNALSVATEQKDEVNEEAAHTAIKIISDMSLVLKAKSSTAGSGQMKKTCAGVVSSIGNLIGVASFGVKKKMSDLETLKEEVNVMDKEGEEKASEKPMSEEEKKKKEEELKRKKEEIILAEALVKTYTWEHTKNMTTQAFKSLDVVTSVLLEDMVPGEEEKVIETTVLTISVSSEFPADIGEKPFVCQGGEMKVPPYETLFPGQNSSTGCALNRKSMNAPENPFSWDESANSISSNALGLDFVNCTGHEMRVVNLPTTINITVPSGKTSPPPQPAEFQTDSENLMMHSINVQNNETAIHVEIKPVNCTGRRLKVFLRKDIRPTQEMFDFNWTLPISHWQEEGNESVFVQSNAFFLSNVHLNHTTAGKYYLGVLADAHDNTSVECPLVNYTLVTFTSSCLYWDEAVDKWKGDGCEVGPKTNQNVTECRCTHLTTFGGGFFVAPNPIDFDSALQGFANIGDNPAVFACVMTIYGLYIFLAIWARWKDKKDLEKIGVSPLPDNDPRDDYSYEITVQTGWLSGAGTTADVYIQLTGALGESDPRNVKDPKRPKFKRAAVDQFLLTVPQSLGDLKELHIWHNNAGDSPSWYLFRVLIRDMQSSQRWWFVCDKWLAVEEDDGQVERRLPVATKKELTQFNILFANATRKNLLDGHIWFSVFTRPPRSTFTRVQRLSCCLSLMLTTMLANAMFYQTGGPAKNNSVHIGPFSLSMTQVIIGIQSSLIVLPVNLLLVTIFRKLKAKEPKSKKYEKEYDLVRPASSFGGRQSKAMSIASPPRKRKSTSTEELTEIKTKAGFNLRKVLGFFKDDDDTNKNKKKFMFPYWCIYIAYGLVFASSLVSGFFCCLYGFQFGKEKSEQWLSSMMISFWQSVIVIQPFKVFLIAAFIALIVKDPEKEEDDEASAELKEDEQFLQEKNTDDEAALKMIGFYNKPPDCEKLEKARQLRLKQREMKSIIKEICNHLLIIIVVLFVAYANHDTQSYAFSKEVADIFIKGKQYGIKLSKVDRPLHYWNWLGSKVIPGLYPPDVQKGYKYTGVMKNSLTTNVLGAARVRQLRVMKESCQVPKVFSTTVSKCNDEYSWSKDETRDFKEGWIPVKSTNDSVKPTKTPTKSKSPWQYQGQWETKGFPYFGRLATYKGGGYIFELGPDAKAATENVKKLSKLKWLDETTRGVFTEINVYNANVNLLCVVSLLYEQIPTGGSMHFINIQTIKIFRYVGGFSSAILFFEIIFLVLLLTWIYRDAKKIKREKKAFFKNMWNVVDLVITLLSITTMGLYFARLVFINLAIGQFRSDRTIFVSFQYVVLLNEILNSMIAIAVLLLSLKFLRILRFNRKISMLSSTMRACIKSLCYFMIMFMVIFLSYCIVAYLVFGTQVGAFRTLIRSIVAMFSMMLGNFNFANMEAAQRIIGPALFFSYMVVIQMVLINMFIGILCETFSVVRHDANKQSNEHEIVQFMTNRFKAFVGKMVEAPIRPDYKFPKSELEQNVEYIDERADTAMYYMRNLCCEDLRHAKWFETHEQKKMQVMTMVMDTQLEFFENDICDGISEMMKVMEKYSETELDKILIAARKKRDLMEACLPNIEASNYDSENNSASEADDISDLEEILESNEEDEENEISSKGRKMKLSLVEGEAFEKVEEFLEQPNYRPVDVQNILFPAGRDNKGFLDETNQQPVGKRNKETKQS